MIRKLLAFVVYTAAWTLVFAALVVLATTPWLCLAGTNVESRGPHGALHASRDRPTHRLRHPVPDRVALPFER